MRKILHICLLIFSTFIFFDACRAKCEMKGQGLVYLHVQDENEQPLAHNYEKNLIVRYSTRDGYGGGSSNKNPSLVLNEKDELIFKLGVVNVSYSDCKRLQKRDTFSDEEIRRALEGSGVFTIKDTTKTYKTIVDVKYSDCFVSLERMTLQSEDSVYLSPTHIYHCKIKLEKKK